MKPIILIGGGGHCISCIDVIEQTGLYQIIGILDLPEKLGEKVLNYSVIGTNNELERFLPDCTDFLITVGQIKSSTLREKLFQQVKKAGGNLPLIISPIAHVSKYASIDEGTIVMHHALINAGASVGKGCIINSKSLIEHEAKIGNFCHISTAANVNGQVNIGDRSFIGSNTVIANNTNVASNTVIAAGSQVLRSIDSPGIYIGHPLRKIR
ncbi:4-amino-6-deoxy-N-Acetyl-D-hexosaminyl-(Lipid carrier) acetyltrasferase [Aquipluma nitroreducens]|uniref:4-amino-6-deoxy-N-Acetyl-D-hexosaminyl-(Lipid carrier) acetyltrasferase n=1 Tax=Aquipluma nitroreducens TaxID=2010828 RepID=A0A5K7S3R3_9BACT|nr:acetyltransferase [Aquipluma nitroreducens]BBE16218.1 4-amino-6-deoxy-N-Acetyl-D-hexosaminyl-(Lipid carrier) acetyltrasferase [Aquipluma nitroreducens]